MAETPVELMTTGQTWWPHPESAGCGLQAQQPPSPGWAACQRVSRCTDPSICRHWGGVPVLRPRPCHSPAA
eukprot:262347-Chlamydomonas_euryale.AAC.3